MLTFILLALMMVIGVPFCESLALRRESRPVHVRAFGVLAEVLERSPVARLKAVRAVLRRS